MFLSTEYPIFTFLLALFLVSTSSLGRYVALWLLNLKKDEIGFISISVCALEQSMFFVILLKTAEFRRMRAVRVDINSQVENPSNELRAERTH